MWTAPADRGSLPLRPTGALNRESLRPAGPRITASARHSLVLTILPAFQLASSESGRQAMPPGCLLGRALTERLLLAAMRAMALAGKMVE
jgi:hypothetical protein